MGNSVGTCTGVPAHAPDPSGMCATQPATSCGTNGRCTMGGACELYDMSTVCDSSCTVAVLTTTFCDGMGACNQPQITTCPSLLCADATSCAP